MINNSVDIIYVNGIFSQCSFLGSCLLQRVVSHNQLLHYTAFLANIFRTFCSVEYTVRRNPCRMHYHETSANIKRPLTCHPGTEEHPGGHGPLLFCFYRRQQFRASPWLRRTCSGGAGTACSPPLSPFRRTSLAPPTRSPSSFAVSRPAPPSLLLLYAPGHLRSAGCRLLLGWNRLAKRTVAPDTQLAPHSLHIAHTP